MLRDIRDLTADPEAYAAELRRRRGGLLNYRYIGRTYASMDLGPRDDTITFAFSDGTDCAQHSSSGRPSWTRESGLAHTIRTLGISSGGIYSGPWWRRCAPTTVSAMSFIGNSALYLSDCFVSPTLNVM